MLCQGELEEGEGRGGGTEEGAQPFTTYDPIAGEHQAVCMSVCVCVCINRGFGRVNI